MKSSNLIATLTEEQVADVHLTREETLTLEKLREHKEAYADALWMIETGDFKNMDDYLAWENNLRKVMKATNAAQSGVSALPA